MRRVRSRTWFGDQRRCDGWVVKWHQGWCHNGTVKLTIKNIPDKVHKILKQTAAERGRSLNAEVILALTEVANEAERRKHIRDSWDEFERFRASMPKLRRGSIAKLIREDRDSH
jgi:plasmid stability protein